MPNATQTPTQPAIQTDRWLPMDWETFRRESENPSVKDAKCYYYQEHGRFELLPVGRGHGTDHSVVNYAIMLFCAMNAIPLRLLDNCSYRKEGYDECQPDLSAYLRASVKQISATGGVINLDKSPVPDLAVEVANTSLVDDLSTKRFLYESLGFKEYWVLDVKKADVTLFEIIERGSRQIDDSLILPGFCANVLREALQLSRQVDQAQMGAWLLQQFQNE